MEDDKPPVPGWTPLRVIGLIIGLLGMGGFGYCSLCGLAFVGNDPSIWMFVAPGLGMVVVFFFVVRAVLRRVRQSPPK